MSKTRAEDCGVQVSRRHVLAAGAGTIAALSGCIDTGSTSPGGETDEPEGDGGTVEQLKAGGSSTIYPIADEAASHWSANEAPSEDGNWRPGEYGIETDEKFADYWAGKYGFEPREEGPPFEVSIGLSNTGTGLEKLRKGQLDIGNGTAPVETELPDISDEELAKIKDHVIGVGTSPIVVSRAVYDAGVELLTAEEAAGIYRGEITDWTGIDDYDGPEREIQAVGRTPGSATESLFKQNVMGDADAEMPGVDVRKGENQQVKTIVANSENAIGYLALSFVTEEIPAITLEVDGTTYEPTEGLLEPGYPLSRDLHCYTYEGTSKLEAAFLRLLISDYGQQEFVEPAGYSPLTDERQQEEFDKLPEPEA